MAEQLGGSRGRNDNMGATRAPMGRTQGGGMGRTGGAGLLDRPATARPGAGGGAADRARTGGMAAVLGGGGYGTGRPSSAPRERPDKATATRMRVEENRQAKEAQYWGREDQATIKPPKRDLPAFWSVRTHGQPFNDERLGAGAANFYRLAQPAGLSTGSPDAVGPATAQQAALRKSLETGRRLFTSMADLSPVAPNTFRKYDELPALTDAEREFLLNKLTPYQRIHALYHCLDRDTSDKRFPPWPLLVLNRDHLHDMYVGQPRPRPAKYDESDWRGGPTQRDMLMRLATSELEYMMRRHLKYLSERACTSARAPAAMEKDILKQAFWRVDPQRTGTVSISQFLQVWQNILRLQEYSDEWVKAKDAKGRVRQQQVLKPLRTVLLDRNMAAAIFVKYGFDKDGLLPYVVYTNALCETPARLLGWEVVLNKSERGKNGLEDDLDISLCLGNAKIDYRFCKSGVFPPAEFTAAMGKRSFRPPKAHMWLEHVYGYAGMLDYTLQSNLFYTHNTGKPLTPELSKAVQARVLAGSKGATGQAATSLRPEQNIRTEFVYYSGSVGVVFDKERFDAGLPCQRFFFGHNNDIQCLAMHPNRKWVATGQQKNTGDREVPYVCIWDVDHCMQLQRLDHDRNERGIIALCFSGDIVAGTGGDLLLTVTSDDKHTIHVWRWLPHQNKFINAHYIPGWYLGPDKKLGKLRAEGMYYNNPDRELVSDDAWLNTFPFDCDNWNAACNKEALDRKASGAAPVSGYNNDYEAVQTILRASRQPLSLDRPAFEADPAWWDCVLPTPGSEVGPNPMWSNLEHPDMRFRADDAAGFYTSMRGVKREELPLQPGADEEKLKMPHHEQSMNGCNGTPPMVYGMVWNPLKPHDGRRGSEFCSYGVKHLKVWIADDAGRFIGTQGSFGKDSIENVLSALYVPAMHAMRSPGDSCLLTGFASGKIGLWVPPYPTRVGAVYTLTKHIDAHGPGPLLKLNDGTQVHGGVRALQLRQAPEGPQGAMEVLSGGADGMVRCWRLEELVGARPDGTPLKGVKLLRTDKEFLLQGPTAPFKKEDPPIVVALDCHTALNREFLAGTNGCDVWEVDADPRIVVEGHEAPLDECAAHAELPHIFATACLSGKCRIWDARLRDVVMSADLGYPLCGIAFSQEELAIKDESGRVVYSGYHLAVSGEQGQLTVMSAENMQPLVHLAVVPSKQAIPEMKYSPRGGPRMLACGASDLTIYLYRADKNYQLASKCVGHSGTVTHLDWSLPIVLPGTPHDGKFVLQSCDAALDMLYWDPTTGKKLPHNMRDTEWHTWTLTVGFDVMGIWPDFSDGTDVNAVDRCRLGAPIYDPYEAEYEGSTEAAFHLPPPQDSADGVPGAGYLATSDDFSTVKLFNYPVVADDAPYKAFRGHASHVTAVRFLADDRLVVSVGGNDRGIYQWRTCGVASGLPPLPVIYKKLAECNAKAGGDPEQAKQLRAALWDELHTRARGFRNYERLKLYAQRVAIEERRINSAASAVPQPKLGEHMVWAKLPGTNQFGPRPRAEVEAEEKGSPLPSKRGGAGAGGYSPGGYSPGGYSPAASGYGVGGGTATPGNVTPRGGAATPTRPGTAASAGVVTPAVSRPGTAASVGTAGGAGGAGARTPPSGGRAPSPSPSQLGKSGGGTGGVSEDYDLSGEVGSYEPSGRGGAAAGAGRAPSVRGSVAGSVADGSRAATPLATPRSGAGGAGGGGGGGGGTGPGSTVSGAAGGRSNSKRYVTDSIPDDDDIPDDFADDDDT